MRAHLHIPYESRFAGVGNDLAHYFDEGTGTPVVLVHGGGAGADTVSNFLGAFPLLSSRHRVIGVDMLGFGKSATPDPSDFEYSQGARSAHLASFLRQIDVGPAHLVGNSMGGATCIEVAMNHPELVSSLTVMGTAGRAKRVDIQTNPHIAPLLNYDGTEPAMRAIFTALTKEFTPDDDLIRYRVELSTQPAIMAAYKATMGWVREHGMTFGLDDFAELGMPVHIVHGRHDHVVPLAQALEIVEATPDASLTVFGELGHLVMLENPALFCDAVEGFWADVERRRTPEVAA